VYLSPGDRNAACYGDSPAYNDMFVAQLTELLTQYGRIDEVWFDGACGEGPNGKKQEYDWTRFKDVIANLQPDAVVAIMGDDVRWVGNEKGLGRETEWSATALTPGIYAHSDASNAALGLFAKARDLGGRDLVERAERLYWWPSEVDVSIRPGWFYHDKEQPKSLRHLAEIYLNSVGRNSTLLLNIPPDRNGRIADADVARLAELREWIDTNFSNNLAVNASGTEAHFAAPATVNTVVLAEDISRGQRVEEFTVEARDAAGQWVPVAEGTTVGMKRILVFPDTEADALRVNVKSSRGQHYLLPLEAYAISLPPESNVELPGYRAVPPTDWRVVAADGDRASAYLTFDDSDNTFWTSSNGSGPKSLTIDMRRTVPVAGFVYAPRGGEDKSGTIYHYRFELSTDGKEWRDCTTSGEFSNIAYNPLVQKVYLPSPVTARYVRLTGIDEIEGRDYVTVGEFGILTPEGRMADKDNEQLVWKNPGAPLNLKPGQAHPTAKGWKFYTAHEFNGEHGDVGVPGGWHLRDRFHMARGGRINPDCFVNHGGYLRLKSLREPEPVDNGHGIPVNYSTWACNTPNSADTTGMWCRFTENMRIEARVRRSSNTGLNDALWFMGDTDRGWPASGEIDLLENPQATINNIAHFTLHSANHYAGTLGGGGSTTSNIELADMADWNIFWLEWLPDAIIGGVNGQTYFVHHRGDNGNTDWPWSDPEGFYMLLSSGLSVNPKSWPGAVDPTQWDDNNPPHMDIDWVRVFVNDDYAGEPAPATKFY
ncbi:MAG: discoidin domain-containing protein, partial [Muribaculaceae bacterium]|nr:discoidin domain-containing protein [Muribaculaceae bacterium]